MDKWLGVAASLEASSASWAGPSCQQADEQVGVGFGCRAVNPSSWAAGLQTAAAAARAWRPPPPFWGCIER